jgi:5-methylthioadenosine/S-adenosylhomocysteine deaminase
MTLFRREFLAGVAALAATPSSFAKQASHPSTASAGREFVLSGGHIVSMDSTIGDLAEGDLLVRDGRIVEVARSIAAPGVPRQDMRGHVVLPGLVDTHWHMWNTIARGVPTSRMGPFAKTMAALSSVWTPEASALGVRLAAAEAVHAGITTVNNWAHNIKAREFAEAELEALTGSGLHGRFSYGYPQALKPNEVMDLDGAHAMREAHFRDKDTPIGFGLCARGPDRSENTVWREEIEAARDMNVPITLHIASDRAAAAKGNIAAMERAGLLGPDVQLVHATHARPDDFRRMAAAGSPLFISPWTELEVGYGLPDVAEMATSGVRMGLSVDNMVLAGHADMFGVMRIAADLAAGMSERQTAVTDRTVLEWATIGGAHGLGIGDVAGSLTPGKRADIVGLRLDALNLSPIGTIDFALTHAAQPANVAFVMIDGVVHKQDGLLTRIDQEALLAEASETIARLGEAAGVTPPSDPTKTSSRG